MNHVDYYYGVMDFICIKVHKQNHKLPNSQELRELCYIGKECKYSILVPTTQ